MTIPPLYQSFLGHGEVSIEAPGVFTGSRASVFFVPIALDSAQTLVDTLLNTAPAGAVRYRVLAPVALCTFLSVGRCTSPTEPFGWLPYREASLWLPLVELRAGQWPRLVTWMPYVFPDATIPLVSGRESWGFAKSLGRITLPDGHIGNRTFVCETMLFDRLASDCQGEVRPLLTVTGTAAGLGDQWATIDEMVSGLRALFAALPDPVVVLIEDIAALVEGLAAFIQGRVAVVNLKQFRDAPDNTRACYQALVTCPMQINRFGGAQLLRGRWTLSVAACESHQVIGDFGFPPAVDGHSEVAVAFGLDIDMDFQANPGEVVWQAR